MNISYQGHFSLEPSLPEARQETVEWICVKLRVSMNGETVRAANMATEVTDYSIRTYLLLNVNIV